MTRRALDPALSQTTDLLVKRGWKKHATMFYRFTTVDNGFIISATCKKQKEDIVGELLPHMFALNQISHFVWDYGVRTHGVFEPEKLTIGKNLNDYRTCSLSYLTETLVSADPNNLVQEICGVAQQMTATLNSLDELIKRYEGAPIFRGPLMCMHLLSGNFKHVRELLQEDGVTADNGSGDVRYHIARYLNDTGLA